jgi:regulator of replication initiation timing
MTEPQEQGQNTPEDGSSSAQRTQRQQPSQSQEDRSVPYHRFSQLNETNKQLQKELDAIRQKQEEEAEERARQQGEYQTLAEKYRKQADAEKQKRQDLERQVAERERLNTFRSAARDVIVAEAVEDAFYMIHPDEFKQVDNSDEAAMRRIAESLADRKPFLAAQEAPQGSGAGRYTDRPVLAVAKSGSVEPQRERRKPLFEGKGPKKFHWK